MVLLLTPNKHEPRIQYNARYLISIFHRSNWLQTNCNRIANICTHRKCWSKCEKKRIIITWAYSPKFKWVCEWNLLSKRSMVSNDFNIQLFVSWTYNQFFSFRSCVNQIHDSCSLESTSIFGQFLRSSPAEHTRTNSFRLIWIKIIWRIIYV